MIDKKLLKIVLFLLSPIWFLPFFVYQTVGKVLWEESVSIVDGWFGTDTDN